MLCRVEQGSSAHRAQASLPMSLKDGAARPPFSAGIRQLQHLPDQLAEHKNWGLYPNKTVIIFFFFLLENQAFLLKPD